MTWVETMVLVSTLGMLAGFTLVVLFLRSIARLLWRNLQTEDSEASGPPGGLILGDLGENGGSNAAHLDRTEVILSEEDEFFARGRRDPETES